VKCPYCGVDNDKVIDSRSSEGGLAIRRRRECLGCGKRFTTYERTEKTHRLMVIKKDGSRVPFNAENILNSLRNACGKRPIPEEDKLELVQFVEDSIHRDFEREVESTEIGRRVIERLAALDRIAYIRYASEYYDFRSLDDFELEVRQLKSRTPDLPNQRPLFSEGGDQTAP
jgi:transcriptional repressor NrdR